MDRYGYISSLVLLFIVLIKSAYSQNCMGRDQCSCVYDSDSSVVDITSLGNNDLTPRFKDIQSTADGNLYSYNPCFPFNEGNCQQVAACQVSQFGSQTDIGSAQNVQFQYDESADQLFVQYTEGGTGIQQTTTVVLVCDPNACTPQMTASGQSTPGSYLLILTTVCACPNGCDSKGPLGDCAPSSSGSGFGGGVIFLIIKNCVGRDQCSCTFDTDSSVVDITSLGNNDLTPRFKDVTSQKDGNPYSYNPCFGFNEGQCRQAAVCTVQDGQEIVIGESANNLWTFAEDLDNVVVTYVGGPSTVTVTQVNLVCDPEACTPSLIADGPQGLGTFQLTLRTVCACPNGCDENGPNNCNAAPSSGTFVLGGGTIFLLVFISLLVIYLLGGMVFMKFVKKAKGSDVIPNKSFWIALPSSIKTGVLFVLRPVLGRGKTYENI